MSLNWNFQRGGRVGGGGSNQKTSVGGSMDTFWNNTLVVNHISYRLL